MKRFRRSALIAALLLVAYAASAQETAVPDTDFSAGKYLHVFAGMSIGLAAAALTDGLCAPSMSATGGSWVLPVVALSAAVMAGAGKELLDLTGFGDPRVADILITATGGLAAAASVFYYGAVFPTTREGRGNADLAMIVTAAVLAVPVIDGFIREFLRWEERRTEARR
ncbi:MAG TPA: hypothetical protein VHE79_07550 [Spirochaetia bacterium]